MIQYPGRSVLVPSPDLSGVRIFQPGAAAADWWDPDNEGLSVVAAYRAINSVGTPWPGGPANYAESLVNQANPGTFDLTEGNGAVPWAAATGWQLWRPAAQDLRAAVAPVLDRTWTALIQYTALEAPDSRCLFGLWDAGDDGAFLLAHRVAGAIVRHGNTASIATNAVLPAAGNYGFAGITPYRDGVAEPNLIGGGPGATDQTEIYIGALNANGVAAQYITVNVGSFVVYSATPTAPQVLAVRNAMMAL